MMFKVLRVSGSSLLPQFKDGDFVLVSKIPVLMGRLTTGDVIAFDSRQFGTMIKVVDSLSADGKAMSVKGTHPLSVDSRTIGPVSKTDIIGKVIWHVRKPRREEADPHRGANV